MIGNGGKEFSLPPRYFVFLWLLLCTERYYGILLCRGARGDYSRDKCEYHTYYDKYYSALPRKYCSDVIKSREILDDPGDREAEKYRCYYSDRSCAESDYESLGIEYS